MRVARWPGSKPARDYAAPCDRAPYRDCAGHVKRACPSTLQRAGWILALVAILLIPALADAQLTRQATITFQSNSFNEDGFIVMRMTGVCGAAGPFVPVATLGPGVTFYIDPVSPFPYACYRAHATLTGAGDSPDSNDYGTSLPLRTAPRHGLRR